MTINPLENRTDLKPCFHSMQIFTLCRQEFNKTGKEFFIVSIIPHHPSHHFQAFKVRYDLYYVVSDNKDLRNP